MIFDSIFRIYYIHFPIDIGKNRLRNFYTKFSKKNDFRTVKFKNAKINLDLQQPIDRKLFFHNTYEKEEELFSRILSPGNTILDIGANIGLYSLIAAPLVTPGFVHSFEANPTVFRRLKANININKFSNIIARQYAVYSEISTVKIFCNDRDNSGKSSLFSRPECEVAKVVQAVRLDSYLRTSKIKRVNLIKIDVEGSEFGVLKGLGDYLSPSRVAVIICEVSDATGMLAGSGSRQIKQLLADNGYEGWRYLRGNLMRVHSEERHECENLVFLPRAANRDRIPRVGPELLSFGQQ